MNNACDGQISGRKGNMNEDQYLGESRRKKTTTSLSGCRKEQHSENSTAISAALKLSRRLYASSSSSV